MRILLPFVVAALLSSTATGQRNSPFPSDPPIACSSCDEWNAPHEPFRIFGNSYYVGPAGLSSVLIASDAGLILIDGALPQSAAVIDANIRQLGFRTEDIRLIVLCHEHYDHVGGIAALQRASGALVATSEQAARAMATGLPTPEDPQYESGRKVPFPAVKNIKVVADGEVLRVGPLSITGHYTPGHTLGAMSWTWQSCEGDRCLNMVYGDSLNPVSDDGYRFSSHPKLVAQFRMAIDKFEKLPCDVLLASHPQAIDMAAKLAARKKNPAVDPFIDANACRSYAAVARKRLEARLAEEKK